MRNLMTRAYIWAQDKKHREEGQGGLEYGLLVAFVSVLIIGAIATLALAVEGQIPTTLGEFTS